MQRFDYDPRGARRGTDSIDRRRRESEATEVLHSCVIVLGMHRSGTSALAGALRVLGADLSSDLVEAQPDNVRGYFEHRGVLQLHEDLFNAAASAWDDISPPDWEARRSRPESAAFGAALRDLLQREFAGAPLWVVKDPRLCRLLPLWKPVLTTLGVAAHAVVTCRSAWEIAGSLARRNGFSVDKSMLLWIDHMLGAERVTRGLPRAFVDYATLLAEPVATLDGLGERLGVAWPIPPADRAAELSEFLDPGLHHISVSESIDDIAAGSTYSLVHDLSAALAAASEGAADPAPFDRLRERYRELAVRIDPLIVEHLHQFGRREVESRLWSARRTLQAQIDSVSTRLGGGLSGVEDGLEAARQELADLAAQLDRVSQGLESRLRVDGERQRDIDNTLRHLSAALAAAEDGIDYLRRCLEDIHASIARWQTAVPLEATLQETRRALGHVTRRVEQLEERRNWPRFWWRRALARLRS